MEIAWAVGAGAGLSALSGFRSFLPLAVYILMARLGWVWGFKVEDTPLSFLTSNGAIAVIVVLAALEVIITHMRSLAAVERLIKLPLAALAGALLFTAAIAGSLTNYFYFLGICAGLIMGLLGFYVFRGLKYMAEGRDPGPALDIAVLALAAVTMILPPAGYILGILVIWLALRVRRLKKSKYKGLRVLA